VTLPYDVGPAEFPSGRPFRNLIPVLPFERVIRAMPGYKLVMVPNGDIRSTSTNEKHEEHATIHTGRYRVMAQVGADGVIEVSRSLFDEAFRIVEPVFVADDEPELPDRPKDRAE
jgi:hypothetical protein